MKSPISDGPIACSPQFDVIAEAEEWIVVSKAAPLIVHPSNGKTEPTLLEGVSALLCYESALGINPALINRLDRETSGLTLLAKTGSAARQLGRAMQRRQMHKEYDAIVHGHPPCDEWTRHDPILRRGSFEESPIWLMQCVHPQGKESITEFKVTFRFFRDGHPFSLVRCSPKTGRTHQIRVHLAASEHPIVGDKIYGSSPECYLDFIAGGWTPELEARLLLPRHALHACLLDFPFDEEMIHTEAPLTEDLRSFIEEVAPEHSITGCQSPHPGQI